MLILDRNKARFGGLGFKLLRNIDEGVLVRIVRIICDERRLRAITDIGGLRRAILIEKLLLATSGRTLWIRFANGNLGIGVITPWALVDLDMAARSKALDALAHRARKARDGKAYEHGAGKCDANEHDPGDGLTERASKHRRNREADVSARSGKARLAHGNAKHHGVGKPDQGDERDNRNEDEERAERGLHLEDSLVADEDERGYEQERKRQDIATQAEA